MSIDIRWKQRFDNYLRAFETLRRAVELARQRDLSELEQQGLIQGFEFTHELAWNHGTTITLNELGVIDSELDDLLLPYTFDLLIFDTLNHVNLREHIERVGKIFYERGQGSSQPTS